MVKSIYIMKSPRFAFLFLVSVAVGASASTEPPYPHSQVIQSITWHWDTYATAAPGSDLWPVAWGPDDQLYAAWGDGGGFGGSNTNGRVALGFARIEGTPEHWRGVNVNGGKDPEHPATFPRKGKSDGVAIVDGVFYATVNLQDGKWPNVNHVLVWSTNYGASWTEAGWWFPRGEASFQPAKFVTFGKDYTGLPGPLAGYVYICGPRQSAGQGSGNRLYLARAPRNRLRERAAYEFFGQREGAGPPDLGSRPRPGPTHLYRPERRVAGSGGLCSRAKTFSTDMLSCWTGPAWRIRRAQSLGPLDHRRLLRALG